jgi:dihydrofolate reductase
MGGGWSFPFWDDLMNQQMGKIMSKPFDLLLGRKTYEIFAAHWPYQNDTIGELFNNINKYVVATTSVDVSWKNTILIRDNVVAQLKKLKSEDGSDLLVNGSGRLIQTLLSNRLIDELHVWTFPLTLGPGKKLFEDGTQATQWKLTNNAISTTGVVIASYIPGGDVQPGSFASDKPCEAEIARRKKWASEK